MSPRGLNRLCRAFSLPDGWSSPRVYQWRVQVDQLELHGLGLTTKNNEGLQISGSAGGVDYDDEPMARAYYELLERVAIVEASRGENRHRAGGWQPARSNGVALHLDRQRAERAAADELVERHCLLASWYGRLPLYHHEAEVHDQRLLGLRGAYEFIIRRFIGIGRRTVVAVFGFPRVADAPLIWGAAGDLSLAAAERRAVGECLQRLAFLWGEALPDHDPAPEGTPDYHQAYYLNPARHALLRAWLVSATRPPRTIRAESQVTLTYSDLTPAHLRGKLYVARAHSASLLPLGFGVPWPGLEHPVPPGRAVHPIC